MMSIIVLSMTVVIESGLAGDSVITA